MEKERERENKRKRRTFAYLSKTSTWRRLLNDRYSLHGDWIIVELNRREVVRLSLIENDRDVIGRQL